MNNLKFSIRQGLKRKGCGSKKDSSHPIIAISQWRVVRAMIAVYRAINSVVVEPTSINGESRFQRLLIKYNDPSHAIYFAIVIITRFPVIDF